MKKIITRSILRRTEKNKPKQSFPHFFLPDPARVQLSHYIAFDVSAIFMLIMKQADKALKQFIAAGRIRVSTWGPFTTLFHDKTYFTDESCWRFLLMWGSTPFVVGSWDDASVFLRYSSERCLWDSCLVETFDFCSCLSFAWSKGCLRWLSATSCFDVTARFGLMDGPGSSLKK